MRILVELVSGDGQLVLPLHYNSNIQHLIYCHLDPNVADWAHNVGTPLGKRQFRLFTFSRLLGNHRIEGNAIKFSGPVKLHVGSVHEAILESLVKRLLRQSAVALGDRLCRIVRIEVEPVPHYSRPQQVRMLSPITVYSTLLTADGRKKTYYYSPFERDWESQLIANLGRKAKALGWDEARLQDLEQARIRPVRVGKQDLKIVKYRDTVIKGWMGVYELDLPKPFFLLAYDCGLGAKNSQGFGMVEVT